MEDFNKPRSYEDSSEPGKGDGETSPKRSSFLEAWLARREKTKDEEKESLAKRLGAFISRLWPAKSSDNSTESAPDLDETVRPLSQQTKEREEDNQAVEAEAETAVEPEIEPAETEAREKTINLRPVSGAQELNQPEPETTEPPDQPPPLIYAPELRQLVPEPVKLEAGQNEQTTVIEHRDRSGLAAALVVDQLARRRDRRNRRRGRQELKTTESQLQRGVAEAKHLAEQAVISGERQFNRLFNREVAGPPRPRLESQPQPAAALSKEKITQFGKAAQAEKAPAPAELRKISPEAIQKQVEKAADKNMPIEALFERSHEIKDEADHKAAGGLVSIGDQLQRRYAQHARAKTELEQKIGALERLERLRSSKTDDSLYKQAISGGFWAGLIIVVILLLIIILS